MFVTKKRWRIIVCLAACLLFFSHNVYAFYYIGNEVHSNTDSSNSNNSSSNNSSQSGPSNTSSPTSPSSVPSGPTGPVGPIGVGSGSGSGK